MTAPIEQPAITDAVSLLIDAADTITERGKQRDNPRGERSMGRAVKAFNAMYGTTLTEPQGWQFMAILKMARASAGGPVRIDDYIDQAGYAALAGECAARQRQYPTVDDFDYIALARVQPDMATKPRVPFSRHFVDGAHRSVPTDPPAV